MARRGDPAEPAPPDGPDRLRRAGDNGLSLAERLAARLTAGLYATPLHRMRLRGRFPLKLLAVPADPVPGDPALGERILAGRLIHAGHTAMVRDLDFAAPTHPAAWADWAHGWHWLRDLAAAPGEGKARTATGERLAARWLAAFPAYHPRAWRADIVGRRLLMAMGHAPLILSSTDHIHRSAVLSAIATWSRHLDRAAPRLPDGLGKAAALCGLHAAGVLIPGGEARAEAALAALDRLLGVLVLPDGGVLSRAPADALDLADLLLFAGAASEARGRRLPPPIADALARLVPALRGLMLGDGRIGAWHGGAVIPETALARLARAAPTGTALSRGGRWSGYHRLSAGKTVLVTDVGPPPSARQAAGGHAGTLAFELSDGPDRLVTNCGGTIGLPAPLPAVLAAGLRTTAAHSTLVIADTNSTRLRDDGSLGTGIGEVVVDLHPDGRRLAAQHDGYARRFGLLVRRTLELSADGRELTGEDAVLPVAGTLWRRGERAFDIRFHLGPGVDATPTADGSGALLKLPQGRIWAMKASAPLAVEPSLWIDTDGTQHRTQQLVIAGRTQRGAATVGWTLRRAGKAG